MSRYAEDTQVSVAKSRSEVSTVLERYGATQRLIGDDEARIMVAFRLKGRQVRVDRVVPPRSTFRSQAGFDREVRRQWRVMILLLKGRLELVSEGEETVDQAFAPYLMLPDGSVAGDHISESVTRAYESGQMPASIFPGLPPTTKVIELGAGKRSG